MPHEISFLCILYGLLSPSVKSISVHKHIFIPKYGKDLHRNEFIFRNIIKLLFTPQTIMDINGLYIPLLRRYRFLIWEEKFYQSPSKKQDMIEIVKNIHSANDFFAAMVLTSGSCCSLYWNNNFFVLVSHYY